VDVPYPAGHRGLHARIVANGLVLSESQPGTAAFPGCFPRRNRLIAALADLTIVVEAPHKSGALNTASQALELGRGVAAVPGLIDDPRSAGSNGLLRDGAQVVASVDDALAMMRVYRKTTHHFSDAKDGSPVLDVLRRGPATADQISEAANVSPGELLATVSRLQMLGLVVADGGRFHLAAGVSVASVDSGSALSGG
jgi:DNA processing protein